MDEHTLNDLLECSVCLDRLDTSSKVLPCQHTFCRKCLEVIVASRQELRCPECRVLVDTKIDELPPNVLLMRILEGMKNATKTQAAQQHQQQQQQLQMQKESHPTVQTQNVKNNVETQNLQHQQQIKQQQQKLPQFQLQKNQQQPQQQQPQQQQPQQQHCNIATQCRLPHAYALYDFKSVEPADLNFKKGDRLLLKRKIDSNWYVGQLNDKEGTFPINYVQVVIPLAIPQCIALYDFKMGPNEEEGCLTFRKGTRIHVLRRVDHNWAEGRIGNIIGIFPIAFVELNTLAKQLLDSYLPSTPPTATAAATAQPTTTTTTTATNVIPTTQTTRNLPPIPIINPTLNATDSSSSSNSSSIATSPITSTTTSSNSTPSSPNQTQPCTPRRQLNSGSSSVRLRDGKAKRHSLNALLTAGGANPVLSVLQTNRHSAEILSLPNDLCTDSTGTQSQNHALNLTVQTNVTRDQQLQQESQQQPQPQQQPQQQSQQQQLTATAATSTNRINVLKTSGNQSHLPPILPWGYLALYPYKPRKNDELELKKGCVYIVTERCLDGWFKGKNWQETSGVFPGNYVTPLRTRDQQQLMHQWQHVPLATASKTSFNTTTPNQIAATTVQPPDLPPRNVNSNAATVGCYTYATVWTKPLGDTVEAFFNRTKATTTINNEQQQKSGNAATSPITTTTTTTAPSSSAALNLMKRLTSIKSRSKSPNHAATLQQQQKPASFNYQPTFEPETAPVPQSVQVHPVHVRSGSCPSQLLQSLPIERKTQTIQEIGNAQQTQQQVQLKQQAQPQPKVNYGSQRLKGNKERPHLQNARSIVMSPEQQQQQQQQSPTTMNLAPKCSQQQQQQHQLQPQRNITTPIANSAQHRKTQSLDATNTLITPVGGTGSSALLLPVACNITAAAIAASATTKSTQSGRECRFRCVVPYPPNNTDIELELHVGDIIYVHRKQKNGWYKGTHARTNKTGLFPASFVEPDL